MRVQRDPVDVMPEEPLPPKRIMGRGKPVYCEHCDIEVVGAPFVTNGRTFCCERCYRAARRLAQAQAEHQAAYLHLIEALVRALDAREGEIAEHSHRVARYTHLLARLTGVPADTCIHYCRGALLHDLGKIGIPDVVLRKRGKLTPKEWDMMRQHPEIGFHILGGIQFLAKAAEIVLAHHEHFDGSGYPRGLAGNAIPLGARIFAVVDALDAITTDRPYHRAESLDNAFTYLHDNVGTVFDPEIVGNLERHWREFEQLMFALVKQTGISVDPDAIERDVLNEKTLSECR